MAHRGAPSAVLSGPHELPSHDLNPCIVLECGNWRGRTSLPGHHDLVIAIKEQPPSTAPDDVLGQHDAPLQELADDIEKLDTLAQALAQRDGFAVKYPMLWVAQRIDRTRVSAWTAALEAE